MQIKLFGREVARVLREKWSTRTDHATALAQEVYTLLSRAEITVPDPAAPPDSFVLAPGSTVHGPDVPLSEYVAGLIPPDDDSDLVPPERTGVVLGKVVSKGPGWGPGCGYGVNLYRYRFPESPITDALGSQIVASVTILNLVDTQYLDPTAFESNPVWLLVYWYAATAPAAFDPLWGGTLAICHGWIDHATATILSA